MRRLIVEKLPSSFGNNCFSLVMSSLLILALIVLSFSKCLATPISSYGSIPIVENPKVKNYSLRHEVRGIVVSVDKYQRIFVEKKAVSASQVYAELRNELIDYRKKYPEAHFICLNADKHVPMANIYELIKMFQSLEIDMVVLIVSPQ